ncbi:hypothetical protein DL98DRAFT_549548 [Cadophora sp. DSE1049]|nr:hypothetical protein DL98DRAFT_549548 [Cadophora sp. DSE1049]
MIDHAVSKGIDYSDPYEYSHKIITSPHVQPLFSSWLSLLKEPFKGVTSDGVKKNGLYSLENEGAPTKNIVYAANRALDSMTAAERGKAVFDIDDDEWRKWCNPELILHDVGVRLEHLEANTVEMIMFLLKESLSETGYEKVLAAIRTNAFLGELCNAKPVLNEHSYFFLLFGSPSEKEPWAFTFFGHHLCLNFFFLGGQMTLSPVFVGAEPNVILVGPHQGTSVCVTEADLGLELMQSFAPEEARRAQTYREMHDPKMSIDRWNPADQRHLSGAFQDNRIIPYEGICATELSPKQQTLLLGILEAFCEMLPHGPFEARMRQIRGHFNETFFSWIGGYDDESPYYYRIQSPVVIAEFDHHSGVFLTNEEPAKYHIHTIQRTPNGNDYGRELLALHRSQRSSGTH